MFFPHRDIGQWLAARQPSLSRAIAGQSEVNLDRLVEFLFDADQLLPLFIGQPHMLTPVTLRAEAWLRLSEKKGSWGGRRTGAGAKRKSPP